MFILDYYYSETTHIICEKYTAIKKWFNWFKNGHISVESDSSSDRPVVRYSERIAKE